MKSFDGSGVVPCEETDRHDEFDVEHPSWHMNTRYKFSVPQRGNQSRPTLFSFYLKVTELPRFGFL
jgi:hypothetical protein